MTAPATQDGGMSKLADPLLCPDCRSAVLPGGLCSGCGLHLTGPDAAHLWRLMLQADEVVERMRAAQKATPAAAGVIATPSAPAPAGVTAPPPRSPGLPVTAGKSLVLLISGVLLFVAASLFLAVTWVILPLALKALIMLSVTALVAVAGWWLNRRGLRGSAETVWALTAGLLILDVSAAHRSGLLRFDQVDQRHVAGLAGFLLVSAAVPAALWVHKAATRRSISAEIAIFIGVFMMLVGWVFQGPWNDGAQQAVAIPLVIGLGLWLRRALPWPALGVLVLGAFVWLMMIVIVAPHAFTTRSDYWQHFYGWPILLAAVYAAVMALVPQVPVALRTVASAAALGVAGLAVWLPVREDSALFLIGAGVLAAISAVAMTTLPVWAEGARRTALVVGAIGGAAVLITATTAFDQRWSRHLWAAASSARIHLHMHASGWVIPVLGVAVVAAYVAVVRRPAPARGVMEAAPGVVGFALAGALADAGQRLPVVTAGFAVAAAVAATPLAMRMTHGRLAPWIASVFVLAGSGMAFALAALDGRTSAVLATVTALVLWAAVVLRGLSVPAVRHLVAGAAVVVTAYALWAWLHVGDAHLATIAAGTALVAAAGLLVGRWLDSANLGLEAGAASIALAALMFAMADSAASLAMVLTILGSALALRSILGSGRSWLAWPAAAVLASATAIRFVDHTRFPEAYCLPAAAALIGVGAWHMTKDAEASSWQTLGAGLSVALVPSLVIAWDHPHSVRSVLVGLVAALAVALGVRLKWQAPLVVGALVLLGLAFRFLLPLARDLLANPFGPWVLFGSLGLALLAIGIAWEHTLSSGRRVAGYVGGLR